MRKFLESERSTVSGTRAADQRIVDNLHKQGKYEFITVENLRSFGDFMDDFRDNALEQQYGSEAAVLLFNATERLNVPESEVLAKYKDWLKSKELKDRLAMEDEEGYIWASEWEELTKKAEAQAAAQRQEEEKKKKKKRKGSK